MALKDYHHAWLSVRPCRTPEWLQEKLSEGFDLHHIDGDQANNDPSNLVLIDEADHHRLHNRPGWLRAALEDGRAARLARGKAERREWGVGRGEADL